MYVSVMYVSVIILELVHQILYTFFAPCTILAAVHTYMLVWCILV